VAGGALARPSSKAAAEERTLLFVDEAGFYLLPFVARTYAPRGQTPVLRTPLTRDHLAAIRAVTPDGRLSTHIQPEAFRGPAIVAFLRQLLRQVRGKLLVIWDGAPIHHCQPVKDFLAAGAAKRLHLERLPGYAPDLNPDEGVWNLLKRGELNNRCCRDLDDLHWELRLAIRRLQRKPQLLAACYRQCGYVQ
jgi:transposase